MQWSPKQKEAILDRGKNLLVSAAAGSGKTAVYIKLIQKCLNHGESAMLLVPEIALTPQLLCWWNGSKGSCWRTRSS